MKKLKSFSEFINESFSDEFYTRNKEHFNSYTNKLSVDLTIPDDKVNTERYDILKKDMLKEFGIKISSEYFAFLIDFKDGIPKRFLGANSGSDIRDFTRASKSWNKKYTPESFYKEVKSKKVPLYIRN